MPQQPVNTGTVIPNQDVTAHVVWQKLSFSLAKNAVSHVFYGVFPCIRLQKFFVYEVSNRFLHQGI